MNEDRSFEESENEMNKGAVWGVVYGDFMSNMMVLFLALFSFSLNAQQNPKGPSLDESLASIQKEFGGKISQAQLDRLTQRKIVDDLSDNLQKMIDKEGLHDLARVEANWNKIKLVLTAPVLFDLGRADLKPEALSIIAGIAKALASPPLNKEIIVEGHTDNIPLAAGGRYESNWALSAARANAVVSILIQQGVAPEHLTATGYGEYRPAAANDTADRRAQNRRIEISVLR
ncbi:MAG: OmpA family protein [Elusimicrobiota bacterium]